MNLSALHVLPATYSMGIDIGFVDSWSDYISWYSMKPYNWFDNHKKQMLSQLAKEYI